LTFDIRSPMFDLPRIVKSGLVRHVDFHESLGSTSDQALALAARGELPAPLLVLAQRQTGGRGRGANRRWSAEGALTFSLVLEAATDVLPADERSQAALVAGLAVCEALEDLSRPAKWEVKWPNDVFAAGGKACGILCESVPGSRERLVVGIGINVNNACRGPGPAEVPDGAVAMIDLDGMSRDLTGVLLGILDRFDLRWSELLRDGFSPLAAAYRRRCLLTGKMLTVLAGGQRILGRCRGIDDHGALILQTEAGPQPLLAGTIESWQ
jgi:BirA family biotin operon repressor/biotin-[acetyl-CoA-carboxylase] ligase